MAVFTTLTKNRLSWLAPATTASSGGEYYLSIGGGFSLLIGGTFKLIIQPGGRQDVVWTTRNKYT